MRPLDGILHNCAAMELNEARNMEKGAARGKKKSTSKSKEEDKGGREEH